MADDQPTAQEMQQGQAMATAAVEAAGQETTPDKARTAAKRAVRKAAPAAFELTDEQCTLIANGVVAQMEARGAFEPPPERVQPAPIAAPEQPGPMQQQQPQTEPQRPKSFAERFRGRR